MSSVLAMMFLVIFGSLAAAMAVVAQGNLRTADSAMKVSRAMSAAETGLVFAQRRLGTESRRFVVEKGVIDLNYGMDLWLGTLDQAADGAVVVLPPTGFSEAVDPVGVAEAIFNAHVVDTHSFVAEPGDEVLPEVDADGVLRVPPIAVMSDGNGAPNTDGPYFRLKYEPADLGNNAYIKVTSQGVDGDITRTLQMDFLIDKRIEFAVISPNRIMIGKNVRVEGPLGSRYGLEDGELEPANGDPLVMRSDFYYLDPALDAKLDTLYEQIVDYDVDGDSRLRIYHPTESLGVSAASGILHDYDGNEYVDDFDLFLFHYDNNDDHTVVYDSALANEVGLGMPTEEFADVDEQLARLVDEAIPDRDGDGVPGMMNDRFLGYRDGVLDIKDTYAKVHGTTAFAVTRDEWETAHGDSYQTVVQGPIVAGIDEAMVTFDAPEEQLRQITTDMFNNSATWFEDQVPDDPPDDPVDFNSQVAASGGTYTPPSDATWESIPFDAQGAYDWYQRPIYENMTFHNVRIPRGNNGLFIGCTFVGVTFIETDEDCDHQNWNYAGALDRVEDTPGSGIWVYEIKYPGVSAELGDGTPVADTKPYSNNIRFHNCTFLGSIAGVKPNEYTHWRNKLQLTGNTRFYIDDTDPDLLVQDDVDDLQNLLDDLTADDVKELSKSSILLPGWSADIGNFTNEQAADPEDTPKVKLKGTIVAGILDVRGTADIYGTLLMTFQPVKGGGPLFYGGLTDAFNTTIGYFGPSDGDGEGSDDVAAFGFGEITLRYNYDADLPDGIPWPISIDADPVTYVEGGEL